MAHPRFLSTRPPAAGAAGAGAGASFFAAMRLLPVRPARAFLMPPLLGAAAAAAFFVAVGAGAGAGAGVGAAARAGVAFFTMLVPPLGSKGELSRCSGAESFSGTAGGAEEIGDFFSCLDAGLAVLAWTGTGALTGLVGRGSTVLIGEAGLMGDWCSVRELFDLGDNTVPGAFRPAVRVALEAPVAFAVVTAGGAVEAGVGFRRFLGFSRVFVGLAFSLSERASLGLFAPRVNTGLEDCSFCTDF